MSDKRRRYRKPKEDKNSCSMQTPVILAKREDNASSSSNSGRQQESSEMQPKILLKTKTDNKPLENLSTADAATAPLKTIIVNRSEAYQQGSSSSPVPSPNITKEQTNETSAAAILEPVPQMTRPATVISSTGFINAGAKKLFMKNSDFLVVGVIGTQGVGKSTICNILANEQENFDYYSSIFKDEEGIFPTKLKPHKCSARSRTESTHMFITSDRLILLDSPPVLCNSYKKEMITNELDDLRQLIVFLSVCHLLIVVHDDYFVNMSFMRLLHLAELMKPGMDNKPFISNYFPNVLFIKNRAKRQDYTVAAQNKMHQMLKSLFKDSQLRIYQGQLSTPHAANEIKSKKLKNITEAKRIVNFLLLPEIKGMIIVLNFCDLLYFALAIF